MLAPFFIGGGGKLAAEISALATEIKKPAGAGSKPQITLIIF